MADVIANEETMKFELYFVDGDTRTLTIKNPKATIEASEFQELNQFLQSTNALIGDKTGATFGKITQATRVNKSTTYFDI